MILKYGCYANHCKNCFCDPLRKYGLVISCFDNICAVIKCLYMYANISFKSTVFNKSNFCAFTCQATAVRMYVCCIICIYISRINLTHVYTQIMRQTHMHKAVLGTLMPKSSRQRQSECSIYHAQFAHFHLECKSSSTLPNMKYVVVSSPFFF